MVYSQKILTDNVLLWSTVEELHPEITKNIHVKIEKSPKSIGMATIFIEYEFLYDLVNLFELIGFNKALKATTI